MRFIQLLVLAASIASNSCGLLTGPLDHSGDWEIVRGEQDEIYYTSIYFADANNGWIVGGEGTIEHTTDGGLTWEPQSSGVSVFLFEVYFIDNQRGLICGQENTVLRTIDGGASWSSVSPVDTIEKTYMDIDFVSADVGWMSNEEGEIFRSVDGGATWELKKTMPKGGGSTISVIDANTIYIRNRDLYRSFDGGETWDDIELSLPWNNATSREYFSDRNNGWIPTRNMTGGEFINEFPVFITNDGGLSWLSSDLLSDGGLTTIFFINADVGWVGGFRNIHKTTNGGKKWKVEYSRDDPNLYARDMMFVDVNHGWLLNFKGEVLRYRASED